MYNTIRQYVKRGGRKVGVMYAGINENSDAVGFGWSLCSGNHGDKFDKEKCIDIAEGRAYYNDRYKYIINDIPMSIQKEMPRFIRRMASYYKDNDYEDFVSDLFDEFYEYEIKKEYIEVNF